MGRLTDSSRPQTRKTAAVAPGSAIAPLHSLFELDYQLNRAWDLGFFARVQIIDFTHLEGLRAKYHAFDAGAMHLILRGGLGYGHISHQVPIYQYRDFTLEGPYTYTLGLTWVRDLNPMWKLVVTPDFYHLIGDAPSQHVELSVGAAAAF